MGGGSQEDSQGGMGGGSQEVDDFQEAEDVRRLIVENGGGYDRPRGAESEARDEFSQDTIVDPGQGGEGEEQEHSGSEFTEFGDAQSQEEGPGEWHEEEGVSRFYPKLPKRRRMLSRGMASSSGTEMMSGKGKGSFGGGKGRKGGAAAWAGWKGEIKGGMQMLYPEGLPFEEEDIQTALIQKGIIDQEKHEDSYYFLRYTHL